MATLTFVKETPYRLLCVGVFVFSFSLILSQMTESTNQEILAASAAYGAVLVVYVGSATPV